MNRDMPNMPNMINPFSNNNKVNKDKVDLIKANISLSSFAGSPEIYQECFEVVSYLKNTTYYNDAGAEIPKGILLEGPPGTGKTLLAKAIASEAQANFISSSGSEFVEVFVGLGANKVRNLFKTARENKPCILFIDEIDAVGKQRGLSINSNDEREQTLNQILTEMDGFNNNDNILIIAATNRKDILDKALLRPGRFDRVITVSLPDINSRKEIIKVHSNNKKLDKLVNIDLIAELTAGFSGAEIKNLLNEAAIFAARSGNKIITENNILDALDKLIVGLVKKIDTRDDESIKRVAIHETGHAILAEKFSEYFDLKKVSIQSTYNGAGGYTIFNENLNITESGLYTKDLLFKRLIIAMGGKAAETIYYGDNFVSLGAIQDLKQATNIAKQMIGLYGMGSTLVNQDMNSEYSKKIIDKESIELVNKALNQAIDMLSNNKSKMDIVIDKLLTTKILLSSEFKELLK